MYRLVLNEQEAVSGWTTIQKQGREQKEPQLKKRNRTKARRRCRGLVSQYLELMEIAIRDLK